MRHHPCWQDLLSKKSWSVEQFAQARAYLSENERIHHGFNFSKLMNKHGTHWTRMTNDDNVATQTRHHCWNCMKFPIVWCVSYLIWLSFLCANHAMPQCLDGQSHPGWAKIDAHEGNICSLKSHLEDCGLIDLLALIILGNKVRSVETSILNLAPTSNTLKLNQYCQRSGRKCLQCGLRHTNKAVIGSWKSRLQGNTLSTLLCSMSVKLVFYFTYPKQAKVCATIAKWFCQFLCLASFRLKREKVCDPDCAQSISMSSSVWPWITDNWPKLKPAESWWNLLTKMKK